MNGKDCLLSFAELSDSQIAAASDIETIRRSFFQQKKRRIRIIGTVCSCMIVVLMAVGFGSGNWFQRSPAVVLTQTESNDNNKQEPSSSEVPTTVSGVLPPETKPAESTSIQPNNPTKDRQTTSAKDNTPSKTTKASELTSATDSPSIDPTTKAQESILEKAYVYYINDPEYSAYIFGKVIDPSKVGEKIGDATVTAGWKFADGTMPDTEQLRCEIFRINDIDPETAVCIRFIDKGEALTTDHYYVHYNGEADLSAVSDYVISAPVPNGEE